MSNDAARAAGSYAPACSASVPEWVAEEIKTTWQAARDAGGEMQAFRIIERMVDRLGYGRMKNNPSLVPNAQGEHSTGATAEGDMLDPVVVPDFAHGNAPEKKLKKLPQGVDTTRGLW